jgi:hypothetical protein
MANTTERDTCPICWGPHRWTQRHDLITTVPHDLGALRAALARLGVGWPAGADPSDLRERSLAVLSMVDRARDLGYEVAEVDHRYVVATAEPRERRPERLSA